MMALGAGARAFRHAVAGGSLLGVIPIYYPAEGRKEKERKDKQK